MLHNCKAACCKGVTFSRETIEKHKALIPADIHIVHIKKTGRYRFVTKDDYCAFFNRGMLMCKVQDDKPKICQAYGDESNIIMTCSWMSKKGRIRSRQERRKIEREKMRQWKAAVKRISQERINEQRAIIKHKKLAKNASNN